MYLMPENIAKIVRSMDETEDVMYKRLLKAIGLDLPRKSSSVV